MPQNRLDIIIGAKTENFRRALDQVRTDSKKLAVDVSKSFSNSGEGADTLAKVVDGVADSFAKAGTDGAKSLDRLEKEASDTGQGIKQAFEGSEKSVDQLEAEIQELFKALSRLGQAEADINGLKSSFRELGDEIDKTGDAAKAVDFQTGLASADDIKAKFQEISGSILETAEESRRLERAIKAAFSDPAKAKEFISAAKELKDEFGDLVDSDSIGKSVKRLDTLGAATKKNLTRISKLAIDAGKDLDDAADDVGEFLAPLESGNADFDIIGESLRSNFGIAAEALREYGAEVDSNGKIIAGTREEQLKAQNALKRYIDESDRFTNIATRNKDAQAKLTDETDKFKRAIGEQVDELKNFVAEGLTPAVKFLNTLPTGFKVAAAAAVTLGPPLVSIALLGGKVIGVLRGLKVALPSVSGAFTKAKSAATGFTANLSKALPVIRNVATGAAGTVLALGGLAVAAYQVVKASNAQGKALSDLDSAQASLIQTQSRAIRQNKNILELRKKSVDQIREEAKAFEDFARKRVFLTNAVLEAEDALTAALANGSKQEIEAARERARQARGARAEADSFNAIEIKQQAEISKATDERFRQARNAYNSFKTEFDRGSFDSQKKALASLESIANGLDPSSAKEAQADLRKLRSSILQDELESLKKRIQAENLSAKESKSILEGLLGEYRANTDQRRKAEESVTESVESELKKRQDQTRAFLKAELDLQKAAIQQRASLASEGRELDALERRLDKGEDVVSQIKDELTERARVLKTYADEEAALERVAIKREAAAAISTNPNNAAQIEKQTAERLRQLNTQVAADKAKLDRELASKRENLEAKGAKIREEAAKKQAETAQRTLELQREVLAEEQAGQEENFRLRRQKLEELAAAGKDVSAELVQLAKEEIGIQEQGIQARLEAAKKEAKLREQAANVGATGEQRSLNARRAELEIAKAQRKAREELQKIVDADVDKLKEQTQELIKQRDLLKEQNAERKKAQGFDTSFGDLTGVENINNFGGGFGQSRFKANTTEDGRTVDDLDRDIRRNQGLISARKTQNSGTPSGFGTSNGSASAGSGFNTTSFGVSRADSETTNKGSKSGAVETNLDGIKLLIETNAQIKNAVKDLLTAVLSATGQTSTETTTKKEDAPVTPGLSTPLGQSTFDKASTTEPRELTGATTAITAQTQILSQLLTEVKSGNQLASRTQQKATNAPDNFADRRLASGTEPTNR